MRIISGLYKGRRYTGAIPAVVRPTTDNVREAIFNILANHIDFDDIIVADICAGTGFMGFEALSRGAAKCYSFEKSRKVIELIKKAASQIQIPNDKYQIISGDAEKKIKKLAKDSPELKFKLVFFDPPYDSSLFNPVIGELTQSTLIESGCIFIIEHSTKTRLILPGKWDVLTERIFGGTNVVFAESK
ncbi:16S rRNA (guanine(966)-N(2))-methyltransferase RsmD [Bacteroidota bacterium]